MAEFLSALNLKSAAKMGLFLQEPDTARRITASTGRVLALRFDFRADALDAALSYTLAERRRIVEQLRIALLDFYVFFERKKSIYGFDPVRALELLAGSIETIFDADFHQAIVQLIARCKDRHVKFIGKAPFGVSAVIPFAIEQCFQAGAALYVVTKFDTGFQPKYLKIGAIVTHWNGVPIEKFIKLNANIFDGGNEAASLARCLAFLTHRPLGRFGPPFDEWVDLRFLVQGAPFEERFTWTGFDTTQSPSVPPIGRNAIGFGGDLDLLHLQFANRVRFASQTFDAQIAPPAAPSPPGVPQIIGQDAKGNFGYGHVTTQHGTYAYIRLIAFSADNVDDIVNAFITALRQLPRNGLIIDMRGNSGGRISAGERLLQLFTPKEITPSRFQFRVTSATRALAAATDAFVKWRESFGVAFRTGEPYTQGFPIEGTDEDANKVGQRYFGPVVIITDALAFSTADMVVAGFLDHEIGRVICTSSNMGAAGGNNWPWEEVRYFVPDFHLDPALKLHFEQQSVSPEIRAAFNRAGASLSDQTTITTAPLQDDDDAAWNINDGALTHIVRHIPSMAEPLCAYLDRGSLGLADMPAGVTFGFTIRRCMRVGKNEGRLLEDFGIQPDVICPLTFTDITEKNQDLITRASLELSQMPVFDLDVEILPQANGFVLKCRTLNLTALEVSANLQHIASASASDDAPTEIVVPKGLTRASVTGFRNNAIVARTMIALPAPV
jgi:hypothetical protein